MFSISRLTLAFAALVCVLSACGGSATVDNAVVSDAALASQTDIESTDIGLAPEPVASQPSATVTLSTGQSFVLDVRSCETQATDPNSLLNEDFFDLSGVTADGEYRFSVNNAHFAETPGPHQVQVGLSGDRDENGVNPKIDYISFSPLEDNAPTTFVVDGATVTGEALLHDAFSSNFAFGESVTAWFEFNCG